MHLVLEVKSTTKFSLFFEISGAFGDPTANTTVIHFPHRSIT
jgi:hypothetical protein